MNKYVGFVLQCEYEYSTIYGHKSTFSFSPVLPKALIC